MNNDEEDLIYDHWHDDSLEECDAVVGFLKLLFVLTILAVIGVCAGGALLVWWIFF